MQKTRMVLLLACLFIAACSKESARTLTISASGESAAAKTVLSPDNSVFFSSDDRLAVFDGGGKRLFTVSMLYDDGSADFSGSIMTPASAYAALCPYQEDAVISDSGELGFTIPATQQALAGSYDPSANVSVGFTQSISWTTHHLKLRNVCALVKFSVPEGTSYASAVLVHNGSDPLAGKLYCTPADATVTRADSQLRSSSVTLQGIITGGNWYFFAVNPITMTGGFSIYLFDKAQPSIEGCTPVKSTTAKVTLSRSGILNIGIVGAEPGTSFAPLDGETIFEW